MAEITRNQPMLSQLQIPKVVASQQPTLLQQTQLTQPQKVVMTQGTASPIIHPAPTTSSTKIGTVES